MKRRQVQRSREEIWYHWRTYNNYIDICMVVHEVSKWLLMLPLLLPLALPPCCPCCCPCFVVAAAAAAAAAAARDASPAHFVCRSGFRTHLFPSHILVVYSLIQIRERFFGERKNGKSPAIAYWKGVLSFCASGVITPAGRGLGSAAVASTALAGMPACRCCVGRRAHQASFSPEDGVRSSTSDVSMDGNPSKAWVSFQRRHFSGCHAPIQNWIYALINRYMPSIASSIRWEAPTAVSLWAPTQQYWIFILFGCSLARSPGGDKN